MKFGVCGSFDEAATVIAAGFDYIEIGASSLDGRDYSAFPVEATNLFFRGDIRLFGAEATAWQDYAHTTIARAAEIGVSVMVVGSGGARRAPEGEEAEEAFAAIAGELSEMGRERGVTIAPESLNRSETNVGNDLATFAARLRDHGCGYTADSYHVLYEWDGTGTLEKLWREQVPFMPAHVHVANRARDGVSAADPALRGFADRLRELGYHGRISLECRRDPGFGLAETLAEMRQLFG